MVLSGYFRKLMGWCPMKDSFREERQEDSYPGFELENRSLQLSSSPTGLQESRILKGKISLYPEWRSAIIIFFTLIISLLLWTYIPEGSFLIIFSGLIMFLVPLILLLNHPNTIAVMSGKIRIKKPLRKPVMIEKEDITQISVRRNENHSLRWLARLVYVVFIPLYFAEGIMTALRNLERSVPEYVNLSLFLIHLAVVTLLLVIFYNFELLAPYQQALEVTTHSNLKLYLYTEEPEELTKLLKNEKE